MKKILFSLALLLFAQRVEASMTFHALDAANSDASTTSVATVVGTTIGDLVVVGIKWEGGDTTTTVCDDGATCGAGHSYTASVAGHISNGGSDPFITFYYLLSSAITGTTTVTANFTAARTFKDIVTISYTPSGIVSLDGTSVGATGSSNTCNSGNITTTSTDGAGFGLYGTLVTGSSLEKINAAAFEHQVAAANLTALWSRVYSAGFTGAATNTLSSNIWVCSVIAFKTTGSLGTTPTRMLFGVGR